MITGQMEVQTSRPKQTCQVVQLWVAVILSGEIPSIPRGAQESHSKVNLTHIGLDPPCNGLSWISALLLELYLQQTCLFKALPFLKN